MVLPRGQPRTANQLEEYCQQYSILRHVQLAEQLCAKKACAFFVQDQISAEVMKSVSMEFFRASRVTKTLEVCARNESEAY